MSNENLFPHEVLGHCDGQYVRRFVEIDTLPARSTVQLEPWDKFNARMAISPSLQSCYQKIHLGYSGALDTTLTPDRSCVIKPDKHGGYGLFYNGDRVGRRYELRHIVGLTEKIPFVSEEHELSLFMPTSCAPFHRLMLGPVRFVNNDCSSPNCKFVYTYSFCGKPCVSLETVVPISKGQEILVTYAEGEYFETGSCECGSCISRKVSSEEQVSSEEFLQGNSTSIVVAKTTSKHNTSFPRKITGTGSSVNLDCIPASTYLNSSIPSKNHRYRLSDVRKRHLERQEFFGSNKITFVSSDHFVARNEITPQDSIVQPFGNFDELADYTFTDDVDYSCFSKEVPSSSTPAHVPGALSEDDVVALFDVDQDYGGDIMDEFDILQTELEEMELDGLEETTAQLLDSHGDVVECCNSDRQLVSVGSNVTVDNLVLSLNAIASNHALSDIALSDILKLFAAVYPRDNLPSGYQIKKNLLKILDQGAYQVVKLEHGEFIQLKFGEKLKAIVKDNFISMREYSNQKKSSDCVNHDIHIPQFDSSGQQLSVHLILNSDGVQLSKSTKVQLWPIFIAVAELPPVLRLSYKNIVLASLWCGFKKPDWNVMLTSLTNEFRNIKSTSISVIDNDVEKKFDLVFLPILLVADLPAKASMLNMMQYNGLYGCHLCSMPGKTLEKNHVFPATESFSMRTVDEYSQNVSAALVKLRCGFREGRIAKSADCLGVKGPTILSEILPKLPLAAPIDYMHQVLIGVAKAFLLLFVKALPQRVRDIISKELLDIGCPKEITRKIRGLNDMNHFKASEWKTLLLYCGPVVFRNRLSGPIYGAFVQLSAAIRLLLESSNEQQVMQAADMIDQVCSNIPSLCGSMRVETINLHVLRHLPWQVTNVGPLWTASAMGFESANSILVKAFTGTKNHCKLIVERFLRLQNCKASHIHEDNIKHLTAYLAGQAIEESYNPKTFHFFVRETKVVKDFRKEMPHCQVRSRAKQNRKVFDSVCYARQPAAPNSFVTFNSPSSQTLKFGQIELFYRDISTSDTSDICVVCVFGVAPHIEQNFIFPLADTITKMTTPTGIETVPLRNITSKMLRIESDGAMWLVKLCDHFDHN